MATRTTQSSCVWCQESTDHVTGTPRRRSQQTEPSEEFSTGSDQSDRVTQEQFENSDIFDSEEELPTPDIGPATDVVLQQKGSRM
ncbi:hypothetical protein J6590_039478 [Homalodisca vitripennis]|nr:hypothetical protein J6590_039478 [Homalodisca vitripennis]